VVFYRPGRAAGWSRVAGALIALVTVGAGHARGQDITLRATTASGAVVKADRWVAVHVTIDSSRSAFTGELSLSWGDARLRRHIALASAGRRNFELHIRTAEPEASIRVQLISEQRVVHAVEVPVRVLPADAVVTLCVLSTDGSTAGGECTATTVPDLLPRSLRGYEAIDRVAWPVAGTQLTAEQRDAFKRWQAFRGLEQSGDLGLAPQPARPAQRRGLPSSAARGVAIVAASFIAGLTLVGLIAIQRRASLAPVCLMVSAVIAAAGGAAHALGRAGPGGTIRVHHDSVMHQIPGTDASVLSMRAVAEFPAHDRFVIRWPLTDAAVDAASAGARSEEILDQTGLPVIEGTYGLGSRQALAAEGIVSEQPLAVARTGRDWTVENRSTFTLQDCRFAEGFSGAAVGRMPPGASATARQTAEVIGPMFTCAANDPLVALTSPGVPLEMLGRTIVAAYIGRTPPDAAIDD
jgi:hypothetical protein